MHVYMRICVFVSCKCVRVRVRVRVCVYECMSVCVCMLSVLARFSWDMLFSMTWAPELTATFCGDFFRSVMCD